MSRIVIKTTNLSSIHMDFEAEEDEIEY